MSDIYCSIGKIPTGKKLGSMKECADLGQIRYYGLKKVDPKLLENIRLSKTKKESKKNLRLKLIGLRGRVKKIKSQIEFEKDKNKKAELNELLKKTNKELTDISTRLKSAARLPSLGRNRKNLSRTGSRNSRTGSRKSKNGLRKSRSRKIRSRNKN